MATPNQYSREYAASLLSSAKRMTSITPDDNNDLPFVIKAIRLYNPLDTAANLSFRTVSGDDVILTFQPGLYREDVQIVRVFATNTTDGIILHGYHD